MALSPRIELRQTQSLVMTPQLQQAIKLLQMSNLELSDYVATLLESNPLLEEVRPPVRALEPAGRAAADGGASALDFAEAVVTLREHVETQVRAAKATRAETYAALLLVGELGDDGYLRADLDELARHHGVRPDILAEGLALVQSCDPAGVGARDLAECLSLQLADRGLLAGPMAVLAANLPLVAKGRLDLLAERCGVTGEALAGMLRSLRALDPRPGARFAPEPVRVAVPDVHVRPASPAGWHVELNTEAMPKVLVDNRYAASIPPGDKAGRRFVSECSAQANWLVRSLEQRARTILAVAEAIVGHQERFFAAGARALRPLSQRALADRIGVHESTVSRVTAGKYLACDRGLFELRYFFAPSIQSVGGGEAHSAVAVQDRLREMIAAERPPRTLSDDRLVTLLRADGIDIARRTVAKYREHMGIPSSVDRRRLKSPPSRA